MVKIECLITGESTGRNPTAKVDRSESTKAIIEAVEHTSMGTKLIELSLLVVLIFASTVVFDFQVLFVFASTIKIIFQISFVSKNTLKLVFEVPGLSELFMSILDL